MPSGPAKLIPEQARIRELKRELVIARMWRDLLNRDFPLTVHS